MSIALGAGTVPEHSRASAVRSLINNVANVGHLTVGAVGAKWLFRQLTAVGAHDEALKLSLQNEYPSFGYWLSQGATTCYENWSGVCDESHPGTPWPGQPGKYLDPNPPTHNHIFLCGGVGEWMYRSLGGIEPVEPGYERISIAPQVSEHFGPSGVNTSIKTVRGIVRSSWKRSPNPGNLFEVHVQIPVGSIAVMTIPLPNVELENLNLKEVDDMVTLWPPPTQGSQQLRRPIWLLSNPELHGSSITFELAPGIFRFQVLNKTQPRSV